MVLQSLERRVDALEGSIPEAIYGAYILTSPDETDEEAIARHEAEHGPISGDPFIIRLVPLQ